MSPDLPPKRQPPPIPQRAKQSVPLVTFDSLGKGQPEVHIEHDGQLYRLRVTRNGKLILNK